MWNNVYSIKHNCFALYNITLNNKASTKYIHTTNISCYCYGLNEVKCAVKCCEEKGIVWAFEYFGNWMTLSDLQ